MPIKIILSKNIHEVTETDYVWFEFLWIGRYNLAIVNSIPFFSDDNPAAFLLLTRSNVSTISKDNKDTISRLYALRDTTKVKKYKS